MKTSAIFLFAIAVFFTSGCNNQTEDLHNETMENHMEENHADDNMNGNEMTSTERTVLDSSVVRDNSVNVASLDENKDGEVYQCPMHFQVISDVAGNCPLCKMKLQEYSVVDAQKNLRTKHKN